jgi:antitoxin component HigA of HigAB toxin-antitoxin module
LPTRCLNEIPCTVSLLGVFCTTKLHYTNFSQINPEGIESKLQKLIEEAEIPPQLLQQELPQFNRDKLSQILRRRKKLKVSKQKKILKQIQRTWSYLLEQSSDIT